MGRLQAWCPVVLAALSLAGCTAFDPRVGASQESCGVDLDQPGATAGSGGYGATATSGYGRSMATAQTCTPLDGGSACDICESTYCCMTRLACYKDPVCVCADEALDSCVTSLEDAKTAPSAQQLDACRDAFSARGTVELARMTCQQAWCATACAAP
jgi:hypothetical protein